MELDHERLDVWLNQQGVGADERRLCRLTRPAIPGGFASRPPARRSGLVQPPVSRQPPDHVHSISCDHARCVVAKSSSLGEPPLFRAHELITFVALVGVLPECTIKTLACSDEAVPSLEVHVQSATGTVCDAVVVATERSAGRTHELISVGCVWWGPAEVSGTFDVTATSAVGAGEVRNVVVTKNDCHVRTQNVTVTVQ